MRYGRMIGVSMLAAATLVAAPTIGSAENKAGKAVDKVKTGVSDSWLTAKTKISLFTDERVKGREVKVETQQGTVSLRGKVETEEAKAAAESIAKGIDGVKAVRNDLQVVAASDRKTTDVSDKDIDRVVAGRMKKDPQLKKVNVRVDAGIVTLTGEVPTIGASARASELAYGVAGVRAVKNEMTYKDDRTTMSTDRPAAGTVTHGRTAMRSDRAADMQRETPRGAEQHMRVMQEALKNEGYDPGPSDGVYGPRTAQALRDYQKAEGLTVTGRADAATLTKLNVGIGGASQPAPVATRKQQSN